jgi:hypothetical protein
MNHIGPIILLCCVVGTFWSDRMGAWSFWHVWGYWIYKNGYNTHSFGISLTFKEVSCLVQGGAMKLMNFHVWYAWILWW